MKIKVLSMNNTQQTNVFNKCRNWGAAARDGDYGPVSGKTGVVINTKLGNGIPALQVSDVNFTPTKNPYDKVFSYKEFMNLDSCPFAVKDDRFSVDNIKGTDPVPEAIMSTVEVRISEEVGVCAQDTLKVTECSVLTQEAIAWKTLGLPFLVDAGVEVTEHDGVAYILDTVNNTADELTSETAASNAQKSILAGEKDAWSTYAKHFDLVEKAVMSKVVDTDEE
jgi:hypothetical protein